MDRRFIFRRKGGAFPPASFSKEAAERHLNDSDYEVFELFPVKTYNVTIEVIRKEII